LGCLAAALQRASLPTADYLLPNPLRDSSAGEGDPSHRRAPSGQMQSEDTLRSGAVGSDHAALQVRMWVPTVGVAPLEASAPGLEPVTTMDLAWNGKEHFVVLDGRCKCRCTALTELAPLVKSAALLAAAIDKYWYLLYVHAGVVRSSRGCLLLPAAAGSGKTTLTAALIRAGFFYLSDEAALLLEDTLRVRPVPVSLCIKDGAWDLLGTRYPELHALMVHHRWDGKRVRYLNPPPEAVDPEPDVSHPVRWLVFPRYKPGEETVLRSLGKAEALHRLLMQCLAMPAPLDQANVAALVRWIGDLSCFEMPTSSLDDAVALLVQLCR
jgi:hypothetical protein